MHIGAGGGYYTTILTELIGVTGRVTGIEFDAELAARAMANFAHWPHVRALHGDGTRVTFEPKAEIPHRLSGILIIKSGGSPNARMTCGRFSTISKW